MFLPYSGSLYEGVEMTSSRTRSGKTQQINVRATDRQADVLRRAAAATESTLTDFVLDSAVGHAERVLSDRRWFAVTRVQWDEFVGLLDAPLPSTDRFATLQKRPDIFVDPE